MLERARKYAAKHSGFGFPKNVLNLEPPEIFAESQASRPNLLGAGIEFETQAQITTFDQRFTNVYDDGCGKSGLVSGFHDRKLARRLQLKSSA